MPEMTLTAFNTDSIDLAEHQSWWITRYSLSLGIFPVQARPSAGAVSTLWVKDPVNGMRYRVMQDAWPTEEMAMRDAKNRIRKRIRTMEKQIANLQSKEIKVRKSHAAS